jgi:predicted RecB family nuclease
MKITPELFGAYLLCPTKCWLKSIGEKATGNAYAEWVQDQAESYHAAGIELLRSTSISGEHVTSPPATTLKEAKWRLALDIPVPTEILESRIHALERVPSEGRGKAAQFIPIRFDFRNKLSKKDKLLIAFDALLLSEHLKRDVRIAKIIHGDDHATLKVKTPALQGQVKKVTDKIIALISATAPPDLILNRHCPECEFRDRCRQRAIEKDELSLLSNMLEKDRSELRGKGIFTVTQLSYTFRPRRRPKHLRDKREKYHHSLKALAIRDQKIYVVGSPQQNIEGTPVYLDVEALVGGRNSVSELSC